MRDSVLRIPRLASLKTFAAFTQHLAKLQLNIPCDETVQQGPTAPLAQAKKFQDTSIGNRFCILPMEGWDGTKDGRPTELTRRRWRNFGLSGAKLIWGGEAVAVRHDGRANPCQLLMNDQNIKDIESLRIELIEAHQRQFHRTDDLLVGLQLTHSGRFSRPNRHDQLEPRTVQKNVYLDDRFHVARQDAVMSDDELKQLIDDFIKAAVLAEQAGFQFVDIKHCHGYLGHELLSGIDRVGEFGGNFENRTRFLRDVVSGIASCTNGLTIGVRISIFDFLPFEAGEDRIGIPATNADARLAFGSDSTGLGIDLHEPIKFMQLLQSLGIQLVCTTAGSPYYNPHIQRPAFFPPSDGYQLLEDPLVGVARQIQATAELKKLFPELLLVGSGYSYLQDWLAYVGQAVIREGWADFIGLGRMVLSYPELPADILAGIPQQRKKICRTFSDCTTAVRNGEVSGCYPLDPFYKDLRNGSK